MRESPIAQSLNDHLDPDFVRLTDIEVVSSLGKVAAGHSYTRVTYKETSSGWPLAKLMKEYDVHAKATISLSPDERVDMLLKVRSNKSRSTNYTMQYRNSGKDLNIRSDTAHGRPHVDVELGGKQIRKVWLENPPSDYEGTINTILRIVERHSNPLIGPMYWLYPACVYAPRLLTLFQTCKSELKLVTPLTDVARLVSLGILQMASAGNELSLKDLDTLIMAECATCAELEKSNGGVPLQATDIKFADNIAPLPFPAPALPGSLARMEVYSPSGEFVKNMAPYGFGFTLDDKSD